MEFENEGINIFLLNLFLLELVIQSKKNNNKTKNIIPRKKIICHTSPKS